MVSRNILIDTNICIDAIESIKPFDFYALKILEYSENRVINGFVSAHSFDTLFYILIQNSPRAYVYSAIDGLRRVLEVASVTQRVIDEALDLKWPDFEDAIHYRAVVAAGCEAIVTRNPTDFKESDLQIITPVQLLSELENR